MAVKLKTTGTVEIASGTIAASGSYSSDAYDVTQLQGYFSLQWIVTGNGTMKAEVLVSNDGVTFHDLDTDITTAQTKTTGGGSDGNNMVEFNVVPCNQIKIRFTETGEASTITVLAYLRAS